MKNITTKKQAVQYSGTLSNPSKMPGKSWGIEARATCPAGAKLAKIPGSVCSKCYAAKGQYQFINVKNAHNVRLEKTKGPHWASAMVTMIGSDRYFRWHDSGDLYSYKYLLKIIQVIKATPGTNHWMPTHQHNFIKRYIRENGPLPANLTVRMGAAMIDGKPPITTLPTSSVHKENQPIGVECGAYKRNGECGSCRKCWNASIKNISYPQH